MRCSHRPLALRGLAVTGLLLALGGTAQATDMNTPRSLAMGGALRAAATGASAIFLNPASMFVVMTINTQQCPVAATRRVIIVIMVNMMNRQFADLLSFKFPATASANMGE